MLSDSTLDRMIERKGVPESRRHSPDRNKQAFVKSLRQTDITKTSHPCHSKGHDFHFVAGDSYSYCPRCGDEMNG